MASWLTWAAPWEFSPTVGVLCAAALGVYVRGLLRRKRAGTPAQGGKAVAFVVGLLLIYMVLQSYYDYLAQHMFWVHRLQHLILHHVGPFLIALAAPQTVLARGTPAVLLERVLVPLWRHPLIQGTYRALQHRAIAPVLFVGLIYFWLIPSVHFDAMLNVARYNAMNWGMALDGLLFWWLMLAPPPQRGDPLRPSYGVRMILLWLVMLPQIALGAYITFSDHVLYDVYAVCGRAWATSPLLDQQIGGLITWVPTSMMSVLGCIIVMRRWMFEDDGSRTSQRRALTRAP